MIILCAINYVLEEIKGIDENWSNMNSNDFAVSVILDCWRVSNVLAREDNSSTKLSSSIFSPIHVWLEIQSQVIILTLYFNTIFYSIEHLLLGYRAPITHGYRSLSAQSGVIEPTISKNKILILIISFWIYQADPGPYIIFAWKT